MANARDFDTEFDDIMVGLASEDFELVDSLKRRMFEGERFTEIPRQKLKMEYVLNDQLFDRALGKAVARLAGIKTGDQLFNE